MTEQDNKIFVRINLDVVKKLQALASPNEISPDLISRVIMHCHECDKWWAEENNV